MTTKSLILPIKPHKNQYEIINSPYRFNVYAAGRRFGKTEAEKIRAIYKVMSGKAVWWVNPTFDNTYEAWLDFLGFFEQFVPRDNINKSRRQIFAPTGGSIRMLGADNFKRGAGIDHVFIDEAAFLDLEELWTYQLRPMLLDNPNSGADFFSSTNGRNYFWHLWQLAQDPTQSDWHGKHYTSYDNPLLDAKEIDDIRRNTPERVFLQEYMAEFLDDGGAVFRNLKACTFDTLPRPIQPNPSVVIGVDWARYNDYTVLTVIDRHTRQIIEIDRYNQIDWTMQRDRLLTLAKKYKNPVIWAEANSIGEPNIEELRKSGYTVNAFQTTSASKQQIINGLSLAFEQNDIAIPNNPTLLAELQAYTLEKLPSGTFRYGAPSGLHDDMVVSLAIAWYGATQSVPITVSNVPNLYKRRSPNLERR